MKSILYFSIAIVFVLTSALPVSALPAGVETTFTRADVTEIPSIE